MKKMIVMLAMMIMSVVSMSEQLTSKGINYLEVIGYNVETIDNGYSIKDVDADINCKTLTFEKKSDARKFLFEEEARLEDEGYGVIQYNRDSMVWANTETMKLVGYCITDKDIFTFIQPIDGKDSSVATDIVRAIGME